jgi:SPP1 family phage portal protein
MAVDNIKINVPVLEYPKVSKNVGDELTDMEISDSIQKHQATFNPKFEQNKSYYYGNNSKIKNQTDASLNTPDNRLATPYSRTMTNTVKGYMYKPGLIKYNFQDDAFSEQINEIFEDNNEQLINSENGEGQSKNGIAFEMAWTDDDNATFRFFPANPLEMVPVYNYDIDHKLICVIRYYQVQSEIINQEKDPKKDSPDSITKVEVYYPHIIKHYDMVNSTITPTDEFVNALGKVPVSIFPANNEYLALYESIKSLLDSYDRITSTGQNENDRFSMAYLILKNYILGNDAIEKKEMMDLLNELRVLEMDDDSDAKFLERNIPTEFFNSVREALRSDIEFHSQIPDFRSEKFKAQSGQAMKWALLAFENLCSDLESQFRQGLENRIDLITQFLEIKGSAVDNSHEITFLRNIPSNLTEEIENFNKLVGNVSQRTALSQLSIIKDVDKEIESIEEEKGNDFVDMGELERQEEEARQANVKEFLEVG